MVVSVVENAVKTSSAMHISLKPYGAGRSLLHFSDVEL